MQYCANITITVEFISLILVLLIIIFHALEWYNTYNTEKQYLVIISLYRARPSEPQVDSRDQPIVVSDIGLQLEIDRCSCT